MAEAMGDEQAQPPTKRGARGAAAETEPLPTAGPAAGELGPELIVQANEALSRGVAVIGQEVSRFVWQRLQADIEVSQSLLACKEVETAMRVQRRFLETTMAQYAEEGRTLAELVTAMLHESMPAARETRH